MNCGGCGTVLEPSDEQVDEAVDEILVASLADAHRSRGVCPLCGHSKAVPFWNRKTVLFALMALCLVSTLTGLAILYRSSATERSQAVAAALVQVQRSAPAKEALGSPILVERGVQGRVTHDETGWTEARLSIPVKGATGEAMMEVVGGKGHDAWVFSTFELVVGAQHKKINVLSGTVEIFDPGAYVDVHTQLAQRPEYLRTMVPPPQMDGSYPCVSAPVINGSAIASLGRCLMPVGKLMSAERMMVDLRYGAFVLQQPDPMPRDLSPVILNRTYRSDDWLSANRSHAFGNNSNHPYDTTLLGSRNPYTFLDLVLEDGDFLHFERISKGTGYANAVYQHSETSTRYYKATIAWNGGGWTLILADGSRVEFPESYNAVNLAQGAAIEMTDAMGHKLMLRRDKQRNLSQIESSDRTEMKFIYDQKARIVRAEDAQGGWAKYTYNPEGYLSDVQRSSGVERHYLYHGALMTKIMDERGQVMLHNSYANGQVIRQEYANGEAYQYDYVLSPNGRSVERVTITLPDQTSKEVIVDGVPESVREIPAS